LYLTEFKEIWGITPVAFSKPGSKEVCVEVRGETLVHGLVWLLLLSSEAPVGHSARRRTKSFSTHA
jgi:hypothetical protein